MTATTQPEQLELLTKLADGALVLAAETSWHRVTLSDVCAASDVRLMDCAKASITKIHIIAHLDSLLDQAMLGAQAKVDRTQSVRDRLFDVVMSRFDTMEENRSAWISILQADKSDTIASLARSARRARGGAWALEASGVNASDLKGAGRAIALAGIMQRVESVWLDDGPDLAKTMARLDQELRTSEDWVGRIQAVRGFFGSKPASEPTL